jgi:hypothetical protein
MSLLVLRLYRFNDMTIRESEGEWEQKHLEKTFPSATVATTNPIGPDLGSNEGYGMSFKMFLSF